jgi:hypothetical protein
MLGKDNIWKDRFNEPSLENENWLDADKSVLDNVMKEVAPRRRKYLLWWFMGGIIILSGLVLMAVNMNVFDTATQNKSLIKTNKENRSPETENEIMLSGKVVNAETRKPVVKENNSTPLPSSSSVNNKTQNTGTQSTFAASKKKETKTINSSGDIVDKSNKAPIKAGEKKANNKRSSFEMTAPVDKNADPSENNTLAQIDTVIENKARMSLIADLPILPVSVPGLLPIETRHVATQDMPFVLLLSSMIEPQQSSKKYEIAIIAGAGLWSFNLNNNYETALDPADFSHDRGRSWSTDLQFRKDINNRLGLFAGLMIESVEFHSGHNSQITYDIHNEMNNMASNHFDLTMASPIGFMMSDIEIERRSVDELPATDLVVDLSSTHEIRNLDIHAGLSFKAWQSQRLDIYTMAGLGMNNFLTTSNRLDSFNVNHSAFGTRSGHVYEGQSNVNNISMYSMLGLQLRYEIAVTYSIGLEMSWRNNLQVIYSEVDFSTQLDRYHIGLQFAKKF